MTERANQCTHQRRLACAQIAFEENDQPGPQ